MLEEFEKFENGDDLLATFQAIDDLARHLGDIELEGIVVTIGQQRAVSSLTTSRPMPEVAPTTMARLGG